MRINIRIILLISECYGTVSSIAQTNWTNAFWQNRTEGKILSNLRTHAYLMKVIFRQDIILLLLLSNTKDFININFTSLENLTLLLYTCMNLKLSTLNL